jgi:hypothetical protein
MEKRIARRLINDGLCSSKSHQERKSDFSSLVK